MNASDSLQLSHLWYMIFAFIALMIAPSLPLLLLFLFFPHFLCHVLNVHSRKSYHRSSRSKRWRVKRLD